MKIDEFTEITKQIENFYQKTISEEEKREWFKQFRTTDIKRFRYIIAQVYRTRKFIPRLADIVEINSELGYSSIGEERKKE